jgi:hypothetical protein
MSESIGFFATRDDLLSVLHPLEQDIQLRYTLAGMFDSPNLVEFRAASEIPSIGYASSAESSQCDRCLISLASVPVLLRPVPQRKGGVRYAVDQLMNKSTVVLCPGGEWNRAIIAGQLGTVASSGEEKRIMKLVSSSMRAHFSRVRAFLVGPQASGKLDNGWRLTSGIQSPASHDLSRP